MNLWVATSNLGKLNEFKTLFSELNISIHSPSELSVYASPPETGKTFTDNARIKSRSLRAIKSNDWVVGDDSGLEVDGLGGLPGIHSARYAGDKASDGENNAKVLKMLQIRSSAMRAAKFRCVLVAYSPTGQEIVIEEIVEGDIAEKERGTAGFGYDSIFIPKGESQTFGELGLAFKNRISHRAKAIKKLREILLQAYG